MRIFDLLKTEALEGVFGGEHCHRDGKRVEMVRCLSLWCIEERFVSQYEVGAAYK